MAEIEHPKLAVMFTDIKGYSAMMSEDELRTLDLLKEHNRIMESVIDAHGGRIVKKLGDAYMVIFNDGDAAVKCGLHALGKMDAYNKEHEEGFQIRIGIHEGAMLERDGDYFGESVNIAARLEQMANPMAIAVTERVIQDVAARIKAEARFVSAQLLRHIRYPVSVYELTPADTWKLYLGSESTVAESESTDVLGETATAEEAWKQVDELIHQGNLHQASGWAEAALSRFGGTFGQYAYLAGVYVIAGMELDAEAALKRGTMLGRKSEDDQHYDWLQMLVHKGKEAIKQSPDDLAACIEKAERYAETHPRDLGMRVLIEGTKARLTDRLDGLGMLAQDHQNSAVVLRGYAEALKDQNQTSEAYGLLEQTILVAPEVVDHQLRRVEWMVDSEDVDSVLAETEQLATQFASDPRVYEWTGKTRLLNLDPFGAQWIFEQGQEGERLRHVDSMGWLICSLMQQGRFEKAMEAARREMRSAIRQNRQRMARIYFKMATTGMYLQHWEGVLDILEEYKRYDSDWLVPQAATIVAKYTRRLIPFERALSQLNELAESAATTEFAHPSGLTYVSLLPAVTDRDQWAQLHNLEFPKEHRTWILETPNMEAVAALESRGALLFGTVDPWHLQLVPVLTRLRSRLDHRLPSFLALAGLIETRLNNFEGGKTYLEHARKLWRSADWPVWEIQEAESALAAGAGPPPEQEAGSS